MNVKEAISGCSTGQIEGLSLQLLNRLLKKKYLVKITHSLIICEGKHNNAYLQPEAYEHLVRAVERRNKELHINSCLRTIMQQYMLRQQYSRGICGIRAAALPGQSNHQSGLAIDISTPYAWKPYLEEFNWRWLGSWDKWHFDYIGAGKKLGKIQIEEFQRLWNDYNLGGDRLTVDGVWGLKTESAVSRSPAQGFGKPKILRRGDYHLDVGKMQVLLRIALNLNTTELKADCHFGATTEIYLKEFQNKNGLVPDGIAGRKTLSLLENFTQKQ